MNRKRIMAMLSVTTLCIGLLSGCGCSANTDATNTSNTQSESAIEQETTNGQTSTSDQSTSDKQDATTTESTSETVEGMDVVDEVEIEVDGGEATTGM